MDAEYASTVMDDLEGILDEEDERKATIACVRARFPFTDGNILKATKLRDGRIYVTFERGTTIKPSPQSPEGQTHIVHFTISKFEFQSKLKELRGGGGEGVIIDESLGIGRKPLIETEDDEGGGLE